MGFGEIVGLAEVVLSIIIGAEAFSTGYLYFRGYKLVRRKPSPIIEATWRLMFSISFLFFYSGVIFFLRMFDPEDYLVWAYTFIVPLIFVYKNVHDFRKYTLNNEK